MELFKRHWRRTPHVIRRPLVFILGWVTIIVGIILLPLPGPGWVVIFIGFTILASEYTWAEKIRHKLVGRLRSLIDWSLSIIKRAKNKH